MPGLLLSPGHDALPPEPSRAPGDERIEVKVVATISNSAVSETGVSIPPHAPLAYLMDAYHSARRQPLGTYIFFLKDAEVSPSDTARSLALQPADYLFAIPNPALTSFLRRRRAAHTQSFYITVQDMIASGPEYVFRLRSTTRMERLMDTYCARVGAPLHDRRFEFRSSVIRPEDTVESLGIRRPGFAYLVQCRRAEHAFENAADVDMLDDPTEFS